MRVQSHHDLAGIDAVKRRISEANKPDTQSMENESEESIKHLQEELKEKASEARDNFLTRIALTTAIIAALAAITSYLAGERADEALANQIRSSDQWAYYQAKSIKNTVLSSKLEMLESLTGKSPRPADLEKQSQYGKEMEEIRKKAEEKQKESTEELAQKKILANGVTLFQISIAIGAISAITRKKKLWIGSLAFGAIGLAQLLHALFWS